MKTMFFIFLCISFSQERIAAETIPVVAHNCSINEVYSECGANACQNTCVDPTLSWRCRAICTPGCICIDGYLRNDQGVCVHPDNCNCSINEVYSECGANACQNTCADPTLSWRCRPICTPGCICIDDYLRNDQGVCVHPDNCCGCGGDPNAFFSPCGDPCPVTCENKDKGIVCAAVCLIDGGCKCNPGYVRDYNGKCIKESDCPICGENEFFSCGSACDTTCATLGEICPIVNIKCNEMCYCIDGYARDQNNKCIPIKDCPPKKCSANQIWNPCPLPCPPEYTCDTYMSGIAYSCPAPPDVEDSLRSCSPACQCAPGFIRRIDGGDCIKPDECCDDPNAEIVDCPNPCPGGTCESPEFADCKAPCKYRGCQCKKGFVKDANGKCIPISKCPKKCGNNEVWNPCPAYCTFDATCESFLLGYIRDCTTPAPDWQCTGRCECMAGFVRIGKDCVNPSACCSDPNSELVRCPNQCPGGTCLQPTFLPCKIACRPWGCQCKKGYVKDAAGKCILLSSCPKICPKYEVWNPCVPYCSFENSCESLISGQVPMCAAPPEDWKCSGRCECIEGYIRINGVCKKLDACCADPNAEFVQCPNPCPGGTCDQIEFQPCKAMCKPWGCQCKKGFVKDASGKCIPISKCIKICPKNEVWNPCPGYCTFDMTCERLIDGIIPDCARPPPDWQCTGRCECLEGLVRINGACVNSTKCCTDPNSELVNCPNPCPGGTCEQPEFLPCKMACKEIGCQCKKGYVKNANGKCILKSQCPGVCGPNEFFACGSACDRECTSLGDPCTIINKKCVERCYCNNGFARNSQNLCIPVQKCPPRFKCLGANEEYVACPSPCPPEMTCSSFMSGLVPLCPIILNPPDCKPACRCKSGYVRNSNNKCVLPSACCTDPNSQLVNTPNCCPGGTCANPSFLPCKMKCPPRGCQCKPGYLKKSDADPTCVPKSSCILIQTTVKTIKPVIAVKP